ncbi:MAG: hypothetical protein A2Y12_09830 [Planctomycetes bacterium GWF2_42_9]|nr:MAG: hypothetical protein A2Y12_09830 [Planctomycetes bacterium GWF2_42_9]
MSDSLKSQMDSSSLEISESSEPQVVINLDLDALLNQFGGFKLGTDQQDATSPEAEKQRKDGHFETIKTQLQAENYVAPFKVYRDGDKLVIIDGRHEEFEAAESLGLKITYQLYDCIKNVDEAKSFMILQLLSKPNFSAAQRMFMVLNLSHVFSTKGKAQQGTRTDLKPDVLESFKPHNSNSECAKFANVGLARWNEFKALWNDLQKPEGKCHLDKERVRDLLEGIRTEQLSVHGAYGKLRDARKSNKERNDFSKKNPLKAPVAVSVTAAPAISKASGSDNVATNKHMMVYQNFDLTKRYENTVSCGNNIDVLKALPDNSVDMCLFSPDYNVNLSYNNECVHLHLQQ